MYEHDQGIPRLLQTLWYFVVILRDSQLHQPWLWFITGGYLVKRWFLPAAARARGQSNDLNREILASNLFNCCKEPIHALPVPSISRCIHIAYQHKNVWEYQWSNFIYNCMSTFLHYVHCEDALLDCSAPGGERCESLTRVDEIDITLRRQTGKHWQRRVALLSMILLMHETPRQLSVFTPSGNLMLICFLLKFEFTWFKSKYDTLPYRHFTLF